MNCLEVRRALGAQPGQSGADVAAHLATCPACARHAAELRRLDEVILQALRVPVPAPVPRPLPARDRSGPGAPRYALAAGLAAMAVLAGLLWSAYPREALATALVAHMHHEPDSWARTDVPVDRAALEGTLGDSGVVLERSATQVSYAHRCLFRGHFVPHLVVQTEAGPMTVMVLTREHVTARTSFDEGGYRGVIVPALHGSLAVLVPDDVTAAELDATLARVVAALRYTS